MVEPVTPREQYLTPGEVADLLHVDAKTVSRWCAAKDKDGNPKLASIRTIGGHRRIPWSAVQTILNTPG